MERPTKREEVELFKSEIIEAQDYIHKLVKANPEKDASSFKYTIRDTARTVYMGKYKVLDKRKFIKLIKLAAKETGAVVKISGKRVRIII